MPVKFSVMRCQERAMSTDEYADKEARKKAFQEMMKKLKEENNLEENSASSAKTSAGEESSVSNISDNSGNVKADVSPNGSSTDESAPPSSEGTDTKGDSKNDKEEGSDETAKTERTSADTTAESGLGSGFKMPTIAWSSIAARISTLSTSAVQAIKDAMKEQPEVEKTTLRRKIHQAVTFRRASEGEEFSAEDREDQYDGPTALVSVAEPLTAWEAMRARLSSSPLISDIMKRTSRVSKAASETTVGKKVGEATNVVQDKVHDIREYWETTQNPLVYSMAGAWENLTGETEEGQCIRDFQKLDPHFSKEEWAEEVKTDVVPRFIKAHLIGNMSEFKGMMGEAVWNKLMADIRIRKTEGLVFDPNVLDVDERQITMKYPEGSDSAYIIGHYAVQQLFCVKNRTGEIIEGNEGDVRMRIYTFLFQQHMEEKEVTIPAPKGSGKKDVVTTEHYMVWKIVDYQFGEMLPYL